MEELLVALSVELNDRIKGFEKEHGILINVCNVGYRVEPERFPNQEKLQLFSVLRDVDTSQSALKIIKDENGKIIKITHLVNARIAEGVLSATGGDIAKWYQDEYLPNQIKI